ncbi:MAG: four helix bundle protein [Thermodesulfobacteriota bacterium]
MFAPEPRANTRFAPTVQRPLNANWYQIRRAGYSIPANIAEGCGRDGDAELARFLQIAKGSASELEYHLLLRHDLGLIGDADYDQLSQETTELKQMLTSFIRKLKAES